LSLGLDRGFRKVDVRGDAELQERGGVGYGGTYQRLEYKYPEDD
jgi:hypothetical protein